MLLSFIVILYGFKYWQSFISLPFFKQQARTK